MSALDIALGVGAAAAFVGGYRSGLIVRVLTWLGTVLGLFLVVRNLSTIRRAITATSGFPETVVFGLILLVGAVGGKAFGYVMGKWIRHNLPGRTLAKADRWAGAALGVVGIAALFWVARPLLALTPGWPSEVTRDSLVADAFERRLPSPPSILRDARRSLSAGILPQVTDLLSRSTSLSAPPVQSALDAGTISRVRRGVVSLRSTGCGITSTGAGFVSGRGEITTAAHVVAGGRTIEVTDDDGAIRSATISFFDPALDVARLSVNTQGLTALTPGDALNGDEVAIFGFPRGRGLHISGGGVKDTISARGRDIYDRRDVQRPLIVLAADLGPGDSGGPIVNRSGEVFAMAIAIAPDRDHTAYGVSISAPPLRSAPPPGTCIVG